MAAAFLEGRHSRYKTLKREEVKEQMKKIAIFAAIMVVGSGVALATTLAVPFFTDNQSINSASTGIVGRIGVKEAAGVDQTLTVTYTALDASGSPTDQTVTFVLGANQSVRWNPVQSNNTEGPVANSIGNMNIAGRTVGAALVESSIAGGIVGNYTEIDLGRSATSAHVLLPQ